VRLPLTGGCLCGAARYEVMKEPIRVYTCHCTDCQRATASAFSIGVAVPGEAFRLTGKELQSAPGGVTDDGRAKTRWVCPDCGICLCGGIKIGTEPRATRASFEAAHLTTHRGSSRRHTSIRGTSSRG
jgi:hypothetical protein